MDWNLRIKDWALIAVASIGWVILASVDIALWLAGERLPPPINTLWVGSLSTFTVVVVALCSVNAIRRWLTELKETIAEAAEMVYGGGYQDRAAAELPPPQNGVSTLPHRVADERRR